MQYITSGAIHRYVPVSAVIISVNDSSLAKPKSASLTVLWSPVRIKFSANGKNLSVSQKPTRCHKSIEGDLKRIYLILYKVHYFQYCINFSYRAILFKVHSYSVIAYIYFQLSLLFIYVTISLT